MQVMVVRVYVAEALPLELAAVVAALVVPTTLVAVLVAAAVLEFLDKAVTALVVGFKVTVEADQAVAQVAVLQEALMAVEAVALTIVLIMPRVLVVLVLSVLSGPVAPVNSHQLALATSNSWSIK
jgi:hypothetical protein